MLDPIRLGTKDYNHDYEFQSEVILKAMFMRDHPKLRDWLLDNFGASYQERIRIEHVEWYRTWFTAEFTFQPRDEAEVMLLRMRLN